MLSMRFPLILAVVLSLGALTTGTLSTWRRVSVPPAVAKAPGPVPDTQSDVQAEGWWNLMPDVSPGCGARAEGDRFSLGVTYFARPADAKPYAADSLWMWTDREAWVAVPGAWTSDGAGTWRLGVRGAPPGGLTADSVQVALRLRGGGGIQYVRVPARIGNAY